MEKLSQLRALLGVPTHQAVKVLRERLDDPQVRAEEISPLLPQAIHLGVKQGEELTHALQVPVESCLKNAVRKDVRVLADALYPVMGPAIRQAITAALRGLVQSINQTLDKSVSLRGMKWRFEAIRTGLPFHEVVLRHTLIYRIEQVFLIHHQSGLLINHLSGDDVPVRDADAISAMLTAILDFTQDSFGTADGDAELETVEIGDHTVWLIRGPSALIACVVRGIPPLTLRPKLIAVLEGLHHRFGQELAEFSGDKDQLSESDEWLAHCLLSGKKASTPSSPFPWPFIVLISVILLASSGYYSHQWNKQQQVNHLLIQLDAVPGIEILSLASRRAGDQVQGLRDPLVMGNGALMAQIAKIQPALSFRWFPYQSTAPTIVLQRLTQILMPPGSVVLSLKQGTLLLEGQAGKIWLANVTPQAMQVVGVVAVDLSAVTVVATLEEQTARLSKALATVPGIVILQVEKTAADEILVQGLRDPFAVIPKRLMGRHKVAGFPLRYHWTAFHSPDPRLLKRRLIAAFQIPASVQLQLTDHHLQLTGVAPIAWIRTIADKWSTMSVATGMTLDLSQVIAEEQRVLQTIANHFLPRSIYFEPSKTQIQGQGNVLSAIIEESLRAIQLAKSLSISIQFQVTGYAGGSGLGWKNKRLAKARAAVLAEALTQAGVSGRLIHLASKIAEKGKETRMDRRVALNLEILSDRTHRAAMPQEKKKEESESL